jgi:hypothetical protein
MKRDRSHRTDAGEVGRTFFLHRLIDTPYHVCHASGAAAPQSFGAWRQARPSRMSGPTLSRRNYRCSLRQGLPFPYSRALLLPTAW